MRKFVNFVNQQGIRVSEIDSVQYGRTVHPMRGFSSHIKSFLRAFGTLSHSWLTGGVANCPSARKLLTKWKWLNTISWFAKREIECAVLKWTFPPTNWRMFLLFSESADLWWYRVEITVRISERTSALESASPYFGARWRSISERAAMQTFDVSANILNDRWSSRRRGRSWRRHTGRQTTQDMLHWVSLSFPNFFGK